MQTVIDLISRFCQPNNPWIAISDVPIPVRGIPEILYLAGCLRKSEDKYQWIGRTIPPIANLGYNSVAIPDNPRDYPCPTCGHQSLSVHCGYQCDPCADKAERGLDF